MRKIFVHGLSALDLIHTVSDLPKYAEKYKSNSVYVSIGGNAANASVALSRLGVKVFLSTVIGNDEVGKILKQKLLSENIDLSYTHYINNFKIVREKIKIVEERDHIRNFQPPVSGEEIMNYFNLKPCKEIGIIKDFIKESILNGDITNSYDEAKQIIDTLNIQFNITTQSEGVSYSIMIGPI